MPYVTPTFEEIRDRYLRDIRGVLPDADIGPDSDHFVRGSSVGSTAEGLYQHQTWLWRQIFPDTADSEGLELHAGDRGLTRKPATTAKGTVSVTGTPGAVIAQATALRHLSGVMVTTLAEATLDATGRAEVRVAARDAGSSANGLGGPVTFVSAPIGLDSSGILVEALVGGVNVESDAELLNRLLDLIRRPPAGGNRHDYKRWACEVPGVTTAFVYPLRRGLNTVDLVILSGEGLPSEELIAAVQQHIDELRPVTATDCLIFAPTLVSVDVVARVKIAPGYALEQVQLEAQQQLAGVLNALEPGQTLYRSHLEAVVSGLPGVVDRELLSPATNVVPVVGASRVEWVRFQRITLEAMP